MSEWTAQNEHDSKIYTEGFNDGYDAAQADATIMSEWISVEDRLPQTIPTGVGTAYSEAVVLWTKGRKVLTAIYNGEDFIADAAFWDAEDDEVTHWMPIEPPKEVE